MTRQDREGAVAAPSGARASGPAPSGRTAFLLFGHKLFPRFAAQIESARRELAGRADVHVLGFFDDPSLAPEPFLSDPSFHAYGPERLLALGYPLKGAASPFALMPGNGDMAFVAFSRDHPQYDTIWLFEYDAVFTGPLTEILDAFAGSSSDLIGTNFCRPKKNWPHLNTSAVPEGWPEPTADPLRAFFPVFRASRGFLDEMHRFYLAGGSGHYELTWPYVAKARGLPFEDMGGSGPYVKPGNRNRFYTSSPIATHLYPGTFRYRPPMGRPGWRRSTLYHPVKETPDPLGRAVFQRLRYLARWRWLLTDPDRI